jgi:alkanesulfonate monooxygenase SsuD/methylene tetrahydromethanopterin reductase-like flavin-dependent oxidoreductase (luciferase family)
LRRVKFGIFFELSVPRPFGRHLEHQVYANALEQARVADELGFDHVWAVEHHFLEEYSHCSAPEVFLTAVAAQTERIRVGHGAVVCVPEMNHPVRLAERAAVLDIVSGGRLELGTARSSTWTELGGFRADPDETKKTWDEYVRVLPRMWTEPSFEWDGLSFSMPERNVLPKPLQDPHPPLWVTVTSPGTELDAAHRGIGCLGVAAVSYEEQERRTKRYHEVVRSCDPVGGVVNDRVHTMNFLYCHEDHRVAARDGLPMAAAFNVLNAHLYWTREAYPTHAYHGLGNVGQALRQASADDPSARKGLPEGVGVGDPEHLIRVIERWRSVGVDGINFILNASEILSQEQVLASLRLFASEVMPKFGGGGRDRVEAPSTVPAGLGRC